MLLNNPYFLTFPQSIRSSSQWTYFLWFPVKLHSFSSLRWSYHSLHDSPTSALQGLWLYFIVKYFLYFIHARLSFRWWYWSPLLIPSWPLQPAELVCRFYLRAQWSFYLFSWWIILHFLPFDWPYQQFHQIHVSSLRWFCLRKWSVPLVHWFYAIYQLKAILMAFARVLKLELQSSLCTSIFGCSSTQFELPREKWLFLSYPQGNSIRLSSTITRNSM